MNIPSDKLSKFLAVGGVALVASSAGLGYKTIVDDQADVLKRWDEQARVDDLLTEMRAGDQKELWRSYEACMQSAGANSSKQLSCQGEWMAAAQRITHQIIVERTPRLQERVARLMIDKEREKLVRPWLAIRLLLSEVGAVFGAALAVIGFFRWHGEEASTKGKQDKA